MERQNEKDREGRAMKERQEKAQNSRKRGKENESDKSGRYDRGRKHSTSPVI